MHADSLQKNEYGLAYARLLNCATASLPVCVREGVSVCACKCVCLCVRERQKEKEIETERGGERKEWREEGGDERD